MNEEYRWFYDFQAAYARLAEIDRLTKFLELEISMYGSDCTLGETRNGWPRNTTRPHETC